jgi:hypothetical protein
MKGSVLSIHNSPKSSKLLGPPKHSFLTDAKYNCLFSIKTVLCILFFRRATIQVLYVSSIIQRIWCLNKAYEVKVCNLHQYRAPKFHLPDATTSNCASSLFGSYLFRTTAWLWLNGNTRWSNHASHFSWTTVFTCRAKVTIRLLLPKN